MRVYGLFFVVLAPLLLAGCSHTPQDRHGQNAGSQADVVVAAKKALGTPYRTGGSGESGYDCSGFVLAMYKKTTGVILPRRAEEQAAATQKISRSDLQPGDLVFFNTLHRSFSHVGIYVGDHQFIHSPTSGSKVRIEDMRTAYWNQRFNGARRVPSSAAGKRL
jgi:cell wall-associated NlpC family hydrolase